MTDAEFEAALDRYGDMVFRLAYSYLKNRTDAEDVMQETLFKLYTCKKTFESPDHERNWVVRVAVNECRHLLRAPWRRRTAPLEEQSETAVFDTPAQSALFQEVMALPPRYQLAIYLHYYEGYAVKEIAAVMTAALMVMAGAADLATEGMLMGTLRQLWTDGTVTHYQVEDSRGDTIDITVTQAGEGSGDVSYSEGEVVVSGEMDGGLGTMTEITVTAGE